MPWWQQVLFSVRVSNPSHSAAHCHRHPDSLLPVGIQTNAVRFYVVFWGGEILFPAIAQVAPENHPALERFEFFDGKRVLQSLVNVCERWYETGLMILRWS